MSPQRIILLGSRGESTRILYNALKHEFPVETVVLEGPVPRSVFLKRRVRKLGIGTVLGQVAFGAAVVPCLRYASARRVAALKAALNMDDSPIDPSKVVAVPSVNDPGTIDLLIRIDPDVVIVSGTRIIAEPVLTSVSAKFVNIHSGITPLYRGVHGGYWALAQNDRRCCGVTVHLVDAGIDTGAILEQAVITPAPDDNFVTYPLLQLGAAVPLLKKVLRQATEGRWDRSPAPPGQSRIWTHPTLGEYLRNRLSRGVK